MAASRSWGTATAASSSPARRSSLPSALTSKSGVGSRGALDSLRLLQFSKITKQPQAIRLPDVDVPVRPRVSAHADRERRADPWGAAYGPRPPRRQVCEYPDSLVTVRMLELSLSSGMGPRKGNNSTPLLFGFVVVTLFKIYSCCYCVKLRQITFQESVLPFHPMGPRNQTQVI